MGDWPGADPSRFLSRSFSAVIFLNMYAAIIRSWLASAGGMLAGHPSVCMGCGACGHRHHSYANFERQKLTLKRRQATAFQRLVSAGVMVTRLMIALREELSRRLPTGCAQLRIGTRREPAGRSVACDLFMPVTGGLSAAAIGLGLDRAVARLWRGNYVVETVPIRCPRGRLIALSPACAIANNFGDVMSIPGVLGMMETAHKICMDS